jgi:hypothetical protein
MAGESKIESAAKRLAQRWSGDFGDAYVDRNATAGNPRGPFWQKLLKDYPVKRALFPEFVLKTTGFLSKAEGWDNVTYWLFEKSL